MGVYVCVFFVHRLMKETMKLNIDYIIQRGGKRYQILYIERNGKSGEKRRNDRRGVNRGERYTYLFRGN